MVESFTRPDVQEGVASYLEKRPPDFPPLPAKELTSMDFALTDRCKDYQERLQAFMDEHVYPAESVYHEQLRGLGRPAPSSRRSWRSSRSRPRTAGCGTCSTPTPSGDRASRTPSTRRWPRSWAAAASRSEACNCSAPDTGNMEVLSHFATPENQDRWLKPLLDGEIRSAFGMTEPAVASSDATNIEMRIERDGDELRPQRPQVVDVQRPAPQLQGADRDGQDRPGRPSAIASSR